MSMGRHPTRKSPTDPTYNPQWSGVSHAPHCESKDGCPSCGTRMHHEGGGSHYCPTCDDFQVKPADCDYLRPGLDEQHQEHALGTCGQVAERPAPPEREKRGTTRQTTANYLTLEDGEYQAESDDGGVHVTRESALGTVTVRLRADYAAAPELAEALRKIMQWVHAHPRKATIVSSVIEEADAALAKVGTGGKTRGATA